MKRTETDVMEKHINRLYEMLPEYLYRNFVVFDIEGTVDEDPIPFDQMDDRGWNSFEEGQVWGQNWHSGWFRLRAEVPEEWAGKQVVARLNFGGEALVVSPDGEPLQGLTGGSAFLEPFVRDRYRLIEECEGGEEIELLIEAAANEMFGIRPPGNNDPVPMPLEGKPTVGRLKCIRLCTFDEEMYRLWLDMTVLVRLMKDLPERDPWRARIRRTLHRAADAFRHDRYNAAEVREIIQPLLETGGSEAELTTRAVGHAHIDTAWLWPMRESVRKCARTFSTQLKLMEKYPDYVFGASQAAHYDFVKEHYPRLYERIKEAVADGRWEVQGAMWVEADNNVPTGESLVRQVLYGKRFFRQEFGVDVRNLWLPDVFGYSAALPQILRQAGVESFVTQKISWSQFNKFPHHTFRWKGIDGTPITVHFPPEDNYNAQLFPDRLRYGARNYEQSDVCDEFLTLFGIGDGGGGPTETHIELGQRQQDLAGVPKVETGPAQPMLDRLQEQNEELPEWSGELYLELHRGTLTTQAANKRSNRKLELFLRRIEMLWSTRPAGAYPGEELLECWRALLTNQFHDILPGSSIGWVYEDTARDYGKIRETLEALEKRFLASAGSEEEENAVTLVNVLSHRWEGVVRLPDHSEGVLLTETGFEHPIQPHPDGGGWVRVNIDGLETFRAELIQQRNQVPLYEPASAGEWFLENKFVRYEFDDQGQLLSAVLKETGREMLRDDEAGNVLSLYQDWPAQWDAWDVDRPYRDQLIETAELTGAEVLEEGPHAASLRFRFTVGDSEITQTVRLASGVRRLDFDTQVEWRETRKMLRVAFPVDVQTPRSTSEIQFGTFERPTHDNTSWERAQFEVCAHRFADLSEPTHGVALLNDCKFGHFLKGNVLDLNLLRSPTHPDETADRGHHRFTYALLPHEGDFAESDVVARAHGLNQPPVVLPGRVECDLPVRIMGDTVVLETLKRAEDGDAHVLRLYESKGRRAQCTLFLPVDRPVREADIMEEPGEEIPLTNGQAELQFDPFEIKTLLLERP